MNTKYIGLSGVARSGKDLFCKLLIEQLSERGFKAKRFALADALKAAIRGPLIDLSGIDILTCSPEEKEIARDYLVAVGKIKRFQTQGTYWTNIVSEQIALEENLDFAIITDIRYDFFEHDERYWIQDLNRGELVHISRFLPNGEKVQPPNKDEGENDPKLFATANFVVGWKTSEDLEYCNQVVDQYKSLLINGFVE
jgi:hypothetical protein